jgi:hypothetical protein
VSRETAAEARARVTALLATGEPDRELAEAEPALQAAADEMAEADRRGAEAMRGDGIVACACGCDAGHHQGSVHVGTVSGQCDFLCEPCVSAGQRLALGWLDADEVDSL